MVEMMAGEDAALQLLAQESTSSHNLKYRRGEGINILLYIIIFIYYHYILLYVYYFQYITGSEIHLLAQSQI